MAVTAEASSAANTRDVVISAALQSYDLLHMNRPAVSGVNERREFTFTDITNKAFRIYV
jgi:hypothetical protein